MNDKWLDRVNERLESFETEAPDGLWETIQKSVAERNVPERPRVVPIWLRYASVACVIVAAVAVGVWVLQAPAATDLDYRAMADERIDLDGAVTDLVSSEPCKIALSESDDVVAVCDADDCGAVGGNLPESPDDESVAAGVTDCVSSDIAPEHESDSVKSDSCCFPVVSSRRDEDSRSFRNLAELPVKKLSDRIYVGLLTSAGSDCALRNSSELVSSMMVAGSDNAEWRDSPLLGVLLFNQGQKVRSEVSHRLPVRIGVTAGYRLNDRVEIGSGVTYANLTSDIKEGSDSHYYNGVQALHYVGIPVDLRYKVFSWQSLDIYGGAGVLAEWCAGGRLKKRYVIDNVARSAETEHIGEHPLQMSASVSAGVQYNVAGTVGIYAEPGVRYYFDDGSSLRTIYKDRPLNFNIDIGVRIAIGRHSGR